MQYRRTKWVWIDRFSSGVWKWECFRTAVCQQVDSSRWMEQQQKKRDGPVRCVCEERQASEHRKSAEPEVVHGSVYQLAEIRRSGCGPHLESVQPVYRWPAASPEANVASEAAAWCQRRFTLIFRIVFLLKQLVWALRQGFFKDQFRTAHGSNSMTSAEREPITGSPPPSGGPGGRAPGGSRSWMLFCFCVSKGSWKFAPLLIFAKVSELHSEWMSHCLTTHLQRIYMLSRRPYPLTVALEFRQV